MKYKPTMGETVFEGFENLRKNILRNINNSSLQRDLYFDDGELVEFSKRITGLDKKVILQVLEAEFLFLKLKGIAETKPKKGVV